jgi:hypothetical protein
VTLIEGSELHPVQQSSVRRGHMDITVVHVNLTDARVVGKLVMGLLRLVDNESFMEEVSILTISMFFMLYIYIVLCVFISIFYFMLFCSCYARVADPLRPWMHSVYVSTTDATIEATCSIGLPHTQVCVTFDKFTIVISLFYGIL